MGRLILVLRMMGRRVSLDMLICNIFFVVDSATRITYIGTGVDLILGVSKLSVGYYCNSSVLVADGAHSLADLGTDLLTLISYKEARKPPDPLRQYGYGRIESLGL